MTPQRVLCGIRPWVATCTEAGGKWGRSRESWPFPCLGVFGPLRSGSCRERLTFSQSDGRVRALVFRARPPPPAFSSRARFSSELCLRCKLDVHTATDNKQKVLWSSEVTGVIFEAPWLLSDYSGNVRAGRPSFPRRLPILCTASLPQQEALCVVLHKHVNGHQAPGEDAGWGGLVLGCQDGTQARTSSC